MELEMPGSRLGESGNVTALDRWFDKKAMVYSFRSIVGDIAGTDPDSDVS
jgi:hypothetical protein